MENVDAFLKLLLDRIKVIHIQEFDAEAAHMSRLNLLYSLRTNPCEISLKASFPIRQIIARIRLSSHHLNIETGRCR